MEAEEYFKKGIQHYENSDYDAAISDYTKAVQSDPNHVPRKLTDHSMLSIFQSINFIQPRKDYQMSVEVHCFFGASGCQPPTL